MSYKRDERHGRLLARSAAWVVCLFVALCPALAHATTFYIRSAVGGKYLDVRGANPAAGTPLQLWDYANNDAQRWELVDANGYYFLRSGLGRFLDVQWGVAAEGTPVHMWDFNGGPAQRWKLIPAGDGYFYIQSELGYFLDVEWGNGSSGTPIWTWGYNATNAQKWSLEVDRGSGVAVQSLSALGSSRWPTTGSTTTINVCWENPTPSDAYDRGQVQSAVARTWQAVSGVRFNFWPGACPPGAFDGIRILINDENPHVKALGRHLAGMRNGMVLNFAFRNWCSTGCAANRDLSIQSIAIHEFGHALGFAHEHNRSDCAFPCSGAGCWAPCTDAACSGLCLAEPQGRGGDLNLTDCDANSIMNYCFNSGYNNALSAHDIAGVRAMYGFGPLTPGFRTTFSFRPRSVGTLCPIGATRGDREFGGGPATWASARLGVSADGRSLVASIRFIASETGGDNSTTAGQWEEVLWTAERGMRIASINSAQESYVAFRPPAAGFEFLVCNDGNVHTAVPTTPGPVRYFNIIADTGANDISDDGDCRCDTQIRGIEFNTVSLTLEAVP